MEVLPINQLRFSEANTFPFIECYYDLGLNDKGDALLLAYGDNLIDYIEYYLQFEGVQGDLVADIMYDKLDELSRIYYLAAYYDREDVIRGINEYYRSLGAEDKDLVLTKSEKDSLGIQGKPKAEL